MCRHRESDNAHTGNNPHNQAEHGVFLSVNTIGVLIAGAAGIGKSELALELITRGHPLIADDAPLFSANDAGRIIGTCPELLDGFLEIRDLGILDIRALFGDHAISGPQQLDLIIRLVAENTHPITPEERLTGRQLRQSICGITIPELVITIGLCRNLAVLVETAARNHLLKIKGYNSADEFQSRLNSQLSSDGLYPPHPQNRG